MPWLGCIWRPHAYEGCKGSCQGDGPWRSDDGASLPQQWQSWLSLQPCHCRCSWRCKRRQAGSWWQNPAAQCPAAMASAWQQMKPPLPRDGSYIPHWRSTFLFRAWRWVHKQVPRESPHQSTGCCAGEISQRLPGGSQSPCSHGLLLL